MVVLALETVTRAGSVAIWRDARSVGRSGDAAVMHAQRLPGDVLALLSEQGLAPGDVDVFAVTAGPGSFTGLRVGIAAVQGFALTTGRSVVPVPTLDALAETYLAPGAHEAGLLVACLDGLRGEVFAAVWRVAATATDVTRAEAVLPAEVCPPAALAARCHEWAQGAPVVFVGNGAVRYRDVLVAAIADAAIAEPLMTLAEAAARIAGRTPDAAVSPHALRPSYLRRPDAEVVRDRARTARVASETPHDGIAVRRATPRDFAAVAALQRLTFTNPWGVDAIRWELDHTDVARLYVLDRAGTEVLGYCACWVVFDELHINSLAIDETARRQGLARRLLAAVFEDTVAGGARSATLEVRQSNIAARALYEGLGFHVEGRRRDYYQHPREDALVLWHRHLDRR